MKKSKYFRLEEFVRPEVFEKYKETAWTFLDPRLIETLDFLKACFGWTITINDWCFDGSLTQRGFRDNLCEIVQRSCKNKQLYCSAHMRGMAVDFNVKNMSAENVRKAIISVAKSLPYPIRLEADVHWVHLDVVDMGRKIYVFK